ncbi:MAG: hypothetical protein H8E22_07430 [Candidatus Cloacimonetes bacterium]|nr:hypothetical protein [Candidatus Cloacimonadota bacterium]
MNHEKHPDTVVPPYGAGEKLESSEIIKIMFNRNIFNSHSQSPDWECIIIETHFCVPKEGFGNKLRGVGFGSYELLENTYKIINFLLIFEKS